MSTTGPAQNDLTIWKGEAVTLPFRQVLAGTTTPVDITGWTLVLTVRLRSTDPTALLTATASITSAATGDYQVTLTHAQTVTLAAGEYHYDVQRTDPGSERPVSIGRFFVNQEVLYP